MRSKLALIVVLASFLAASLLGSAAAGADPVVESTTTVPTVTTTTPVPTLQAPACANGVDDDGDGLADLGDPDCASASDENEATEAPAAPAAPSAGSEATAGTPLSPSTPASGSEETKPRQPGGGVPHGATLGGGPVGGRRGAVRNEALGDISGGNGNAGGVPAPGATAGEQPLAA